MTEIRPGSRLVSVITPCFNEEGNIEEIHRRVEAVFVKLGRFDYEHIFIDNASSDGTVEALRRLAARDRRVRVIVNVRNFGHVRSPYYAMLQARGEAVIGLAADLEDPPELI